MKIIVCGAGTIGRSIVSYLAQGNNDVIVIDNDQRRLDAFTKELDVQPVFGSSSHVDVLERAGASDADIILAVTDNDEVNIVTCEIAHWMFDVPQKIARLSENMNDPRWGDLFNDKKIAIDRIISPDIEVAEAIYTLLKIPGAIEAYPFVDKRLHLLAVSIDKKSLFLGKTVMQFEKAIDSRVKITNIIRKSVSITPKSDDIIEVGDKIYFFVCSDVMEEAIQALGAAKPSNERVIIFGGNSIARYLAQIIEKDDNFLNVKIIDDDYARAMNLAQGLEDTVVIKGDMMSDVILDEAGIDRADASVAVTDYDKDNLLASLLASTRGVTTCISLINSRRYNTLIDDLSGSVLVDLSAVMISKILKDIRKSNISRAYSISGGPGEVWEMVIGEASSWIGHKLAELKMPPKSHVCAIVREDEIVYATLHDKLKAGDVIVVFVDAGDVKKVENIFA